MRRLVLGVDGGGTKSHYALADVDGDLVGFLEGGPANHEAYPGGFGAAAEELSASIGALLSRNGAAPADIASSVFGLAGADVPSQVKAYEAILAGLGLSAPIVCNDSFLGVKAGTSNGYGACSINGTGTTAAAIDPSGSRVQVGGTGFYFGDEAGAGHIAMMALRAVYDSLFRCGEATSMRGPVFRLLGLGPGESGRYVEAAAGVSAEDDPDAILELVRLAFSAATAGDGPASALLAGSGAQMGRSLAGAIRALDFPVGSPIEVVIAGSVSLKGSSPILVDAFKAEAVRLSGRTLEFCNLEAPPVLGALLWAFEAAGAEHCPRARSALEADLKRASESS